MEQYGSLIAYQETPYFSDFNLEKLAINQSLTVLSGPTEKYLITYKKKKSQTPKNQSIKGDHQVVGPKKTHKKNTFLHAVYNEAMGLLPTGSCGLFTWI